MPTTTADRLRDVRLSAGLTQLELGELAGISVRTIGRLEHGEREMRASTAKRLTRSLDVMLEELLDKNYWHKR
jgi:transcriptional regulator with XRE-family HTH domain